MTTYVKASDSLITVVDEKGKEHKVTQRAYDIVYKAKGYRPINAQETHETLKGDVVNDLFTATREELETSTVKVLKAFLDEEQIDYPSTAIKEDLINLILGE